jgi:hypothetical protein
MNADYIEWSKLPLTQLETRFWAPPSDDNVGYERYYFSELSFAIGKKGQDGIDYLLLASKKAKGPRLAGILDSLSKVDDPRASQLALACISQEDDTVVLAAALDCLRFQQVPISEDDSFLRVAAGADSVLRIAALRYIAWRDGLAAIPVLIQALGDPSPEIRCAAIDELEEKGLPELIPSLEPLLADPDPEVRTVADDAIKQIRHNHAL